MVGDGFIGNLKAWAVRLLLSYIGAYVEDLDREQLSMGVFGGKLVLRDLLLKKSALDKLNLPFEVIEGRVGLFSLHLNWFFFATTPLEVVIEDVQVLVAASSTTEYSREEDEQRAQQLKQERLERAEALRIGQVTEQVSYSEALFQSVSTRIINNAQVSIQNVHIRYEDKQTAPEHPFAAGVTLASLSAISTDKNWQPAYLDASVESINKLVRLDSLAVYFNTDTESIARLEYTTSKERFRSQISSEANPVDHQYILKPVSGEGRIILNKKWGKNDVPHYDATLLFEELSFTLDNHQYRDVVSLADVYHIYARRHKYRKYRPEDSEFTANRPRALLKFAMTAICKEIHEKNLRWTWDHFRKRRDDRHRYVQMFKEKELARIDEVKEELKSLELRLGYHDIRFYRSIARSELKKDENSMKIIAEKKRKQQQQSGGWMGWLWSSSSSGDPNSTMTEEDRRGLFEILDYDEKAELAESFEASRESISKRLKIHLKEGSFRLKSSPHDGRKEIISLVFDSFELGGIQRLENLEFSLGLGNFRVFDGTTANSLYSQIVHVKSNEDVGDKTIPFEMQNDPFFSLKYEYKPLDERADNGLTVNLRSMEVIYQRGYIEAVVNFFKPPESQLQSVEALLNVAGETLEGIQKETRAGLEYALETHKTIDLRLDMRAPIIIVPESTTEEHCYHLVIDAGRVLVESTLADKAALREIERKRKHKYTDDDYKQLESMMYDNYSVKLIAAQFVIGRGLDACRTVLRSEMPDPKSHLLERVNIELIAQNSIVPSARSLARLRMSGRLQNLHVNFSDSKYKTLVRLLDVTLPRFGEDTGASSSAQVRLQAAQKPPSSFFDAGQIDYVVDDETGKGFVVGESEDQRDSITSRTQSTNYRQHQFELSFQVDSLQATLLRSLEDGSEKKLGDVQLDRFLLKFAMAKFEMKVDIKLRSIHLTSLCPGSDPLALVSTESGSSEDADLMNVVYHRVQKDSPDFDKVHDGFDQSVEVKLSTFIFRAVPEHVLNLYDYIISTFVPGRDGPNNKEGNQQLLDNVPAQMPQQIINSDRIRVRAKLASFQVLLLDGDMRVATLSLSTANLDVSLHEGVVLVTARLGNVLLTDDSLLKTSNQEFKQLLTIEGSELAELRYQTFSAEEATRKGVNSSVELKTGSLRFHLLDFPLNNIYLFLLKLASLKGLYDAATDAAVQKASEIERMAFQLSVKSPTVIFPIDPLSSEDKFTMKLGEVAAKNDYVGPMHQIAASLKGIHLTSTVHLPGGPSRLTIIDEVNISADITQSSILGRQGTTESSDFKVLVSISDVKVHLTEVQVNNIIALSRSITFVPGGAPQQYPEPHFDEVDQQLIHSEQPVVDTDKANPETNLEPELSPSPSSSGHVKVNLNLSLNAVKLHLYDAGATFEVDLKNHGIVRFALNDGSMNFKMLEGGAMEADVAIQSFTMSNTQPGPSRFREIIPATNHGRAQVKALFTTSGGVKPSTYALITVDSPQIIFSVDPIFALSSFFLGAFQSQSVNGENSAQLTTSGETAVQITKEQTQFRYRFDLQDASINVLENDQDGESQAIRLSLKQMSVSQQETLALSITRLGMSLMRMGNQTDAVRFLDEVDLSLSLDSHSDAYKQKTKIDVKMQPVVFRTSYRDISLITSIANKAIALFSKSNSEKQEDPKQTAFNNATSVVVSKSRAGDGESGATATMGKSADHSQPSLSAKVITTTEELTAAVDGFRLVLIGDLHESPVLHLETKPFSLSLVNWSGQLHAMTTISTTVNYWNLKNSHWEPFIDPWTFSAMARKDTTTSGFLITVSSRELLDVNFSSSLIEMALSTAKIWNREGNRVLQKARGSYAPYRIRNRTGGPLLIWSDLDGSTNAGAFPSVKVEQGDTVDWRFDDWKTMREHVSSSSSNSIGIKFENKPWEHLRSLPVDREGEYAYSLRPRTSRGANKMMCEILIKDNVKIVTLRSTYKIANQTFYPLEITLVDTTGHPVYPIEKIAPGQDFVLPIEAVSQNRIRLQPDQGFGYKWSQPIWWEDMGEVPSTGLTIRCPHMDRKEAPFHFTLWPVWASPSKDYPQLKLNLRSPLELENLLPYDIQYKVFDKDSNHNWNSFLRKGGNTPVHSIELSHLVLLSITVQDTVFKPSDFTIINTDRKFEFDQEHQITLTDAQDRKLSLMLNYVKFADAGGAFKVQIYSPFVVVNKTGLPFGVKSVRSAGLYRDIAGETSKDELARSSPFMLSHHAKKGNEFVFKVGDSGWSQTIRFDVPSAESAMVIPSGSQKSEIHVGLSWSEGSGKYKLTKVIELTPRFFVYNKLHQAICFREHGTPPLGRSELLPGERSPFHFLRIDERRLLTVAYPGLDAQWSPAVDMEAIGSIHIRMRPPGSTSRQAAHLIAVNVVLEKATFFVILSPHDGPWPFIIENESDFEISFGQSDEIRDKPESELIYTLKPHGKMSYAWDFPAVEKKRIYLSCNKRGRKVDIMEIGVLPPLKHITGILSLDVRADGPTQLLSVTNYSEETSLYKPKRRNTGSISRSDTISTSQDFEAVQDDVPPSLLLKLDLEGLGISFMNKKLEEVIYFSIKNLRAEYTNSPVAQAVNLSCGTLQIDNQLHDAFFPVLLQPTPLSKEARNLGSLPTVQVSVIVLNDSAHGVLFIKYASVLLQAVTVQVDEAFLYAVLDLTKLEGVDWETESENILIQNVDQISEPETTRNGQDVYFEVLELQPILLSVSFVRNMTPSDDDTQKLATRNPLAVALNVLTMTLANAEGVELQLNALGLRDIRLTLPDIQARIMYHYRQEVLRQIYRVLGSADFLGNPVGLFTNVSSGVADIFYEPWHGVVQHGGGELGVGIAKGAASFVKKTVFGITDSMTKVTSSLGKGLSAATLDAEYQAKRRMTQRRNKPRHALVGVTAGAEALANSVASGVEGVLMKPFEGAEAEGAFGFFKGMGKGIVGAVTKPVVGVFDLASNVTEGIRNTTTVFDAPQRDRVRKPRHVPADGVLQPYSAREALGQYWMKDLQDGKFRKEFYVAHIDLQGSDEVILLTNVSVLAFSSRDLRLQWSMPLRSVKGIQGDHNGIRFASKAGSAYDRFVVIQDNTSKDWFFEQVKGVVQAFNARRRLER